MSISCAAMQAFHCLEKCLDSSVLVSFIMVGLPWGQVFGALQSMSSSISLDASSLEMASPAFMLERQAALIIFSIFSGFGMFVSCRIDSSIS